MVDHTFGIADIDILALHAQAHHDIQTGQRGGACTGDRDLHVADLLADQFQSIEHGRGGNDGGAMLVVMEHRDVHAIAQLLLDVEALGRLDVFEVDAAQGGFHRGNDLDQSIRVVLGQFDVEHIDACKFLEQAAFAFHHRLAGQGADVAQAQHRGAVGDHPHQIAARRVLVGQRGVCLDVQARIRHAGRVSQRQVALVGQRFGRVDRNLPAHRRAVVFARSVAQSRFGRGQGLVHGISSDAAVRAAVAPEPTAKRGGIASVIAANPICIKSAGIR
jgi:hypothetical protein